MLKAQREGTEETSTLDLRLHGIVKHLFSRPALELE